MKRHLIIDANNLLYRSFWVANQFGKDDANKQDIFIFLRAVKAYAELYKPIDKVWCVWDARLAYPQGNFRSEIAQDEYKGGRNNEKFKEVYENVPELKSMLEDMGAQNMYPYRMEADDLMAWLSDNVDGESIIASSDKDMLQLVNDYVTVYNPMAKKEYTVSNFEEMTGFATPNDYFWFRCFTGDKSDNISGIPRFGNKKYQKIAPETAPEKVIESVDSYDIKDEQKEIVRRNFELMNLHYGYTVYKEETITYRAQFHQSLDTNDWDKFKSKCIELEFFAIVNKLGEWRKLFTGDNPLVDSINKLIKEKIKI